MDDGSQGTYITWMTQGVPSHPSQLSAGLVVNLASRQHGYLDRSLVRISSVIAAQTKQC